MATGSNDDIIDRSTSTTAERPNGGAGFDTLIGGSGNDTLNGGNGAD